MHPILRLSPLLLASLFASACHDTGASAKKSVFIDVHEFGPGKVTPAAVAEAHRADLAVEAKRDVHFVDYWVDEEHGNVYCLSEAPDAHAVVETHREAHGLLPARVMPVASGQPTTTAASGGRILFLDLHHLGPGNVTAQAVAEAHVKDLQTEGRFGVRFLNYWVDEKGGTVVCLSEAPGPDAVRETHRQAHGLLPDQILKVTAAPH